MLVVTRLNKIKEIVLEEKSVTVSELSELFHVTPETIRRDLKTLEDSGVLKKTYGGAYVEDGVSNEVNFSIKENILVESKRLIAERCREFISNGDTIFLDASTTVSCLCEVIAGMRLTVLTNSLNVINQLSKSKDFTLISIGGNLSTKSMSFVGISAIQNMSNYYVDKAFISCEALSMQSGLTDSTEEQARIRQIAIQRSRKTFLLADHTKFNKSCFQHINGFENIDSIVVDQAPAGNWKDFLEAQQVQFICCT